MKRITLKDSIAAIERKGILLVFPIDNAREPMSLWSEFYPRKKMEWVWDETGSEGVARLWHLRTELAESKKVLYTKWYRGRATFFSREIFVAMLATLGVHTDPRKLSSDAKTLLDTVEMDSPLSTKQLKQLAGLQGRFNEAAYQRGTKELWSKLLLVAVGEVEDSSFPSLSIGATRLLFEDLWTEAEEMSPECASGIIEKKLPADSLFLKFYRTSLRRALPL